MVTLNKKLQGSIDNKDYYIIKPTMSISPNKYLLNEKDAFNVETKTLLLKDFYIGSRYDASAYIGTPPTHMYSRDIYINNANFRITPSDIINIKESFDTIKQITIYNSLYDYLDTLLIRKEKREESDNKYTIKSTNNNFLFPEKIYTIDIEPDYEVPAHIHVDSPIRYNIQIYIQDELGSLKQTISKYITDEAVEKLRSMKDKDVIQIRISNEFKTFDTLRESDRNTEEYNIQLKSPDFVIKSSRSNRFLPQYDSSLINEHTYTFRL